MGMAEEERPAWIVEVGDTIYVFDEEEWDEELEEWEDPYSCFGTFKPGIEECEACPLREECKKVTEPWWIEEERDV